MKSLETLRFFRRMHTEALAKRGAAGSMLATMVLASSQYAKETGNRYGRIMECDVKLAKRVHHYGELASRISKWILE